ncbi:MAG: molybdopterin dinucleotide binding domain-containing protein [Candidatus Hodarchaeota archaeon]
MEMILNTVRMVDYDQVKEYSFGDDNSLKENLAIGIINPKDFNKLKLTSDSNLKLSNENGEAIVKVKQDERIPLGTVVMPVSIWANQLTGINNEILILKNLKTNAEATRETVLDIKDLLKTIIKK